MLNVAAVLLFLYAAFWIAGAFIAIYPAAGAVGVVGLAASFLSWRKQRAALYAAGAFAVGVGVLWALDLFRWFGRGVGVVDMRGAILAGVPTLLAIAIALLVKRGLRVRANIGLHRTAASGNEG